MEYREEKKYVGNREQLLRVNKIEMQDGKAAGAKMYNVYNHSGMQFDVNISRGLDITHLDFLGENFGFVSPCGIVSPQYFDDKGLGFLKSFTAGFMTTCGLKVAGAPCDYEGKAYGLHGNISHTPAEEVTCTIVEDGENPYIKITGTIRDTVLFGDKLVLKREIKCGYKERKITINDKVINEGYTEARHMMLYHCNIGYPLLTPNSELFIPSKEIKSRNAQAEKGINTWRDIQFPDSGYEEMCYYHKLEVDNHNMTSVAVFNNDLNMGVSIEFNADTLDHFMQWKMMGAGEYVLGLEPCNCTIDGISDALENRSMKYIKPGEYIEHSLTFHVLDNREMFDAIRKRFY